MRNLPALFLSLILSGFSILQAAPSATPYSSTPSSIPKPQFSLPTATLLLGTNALTAQIAATEETRELGLMSRTNLSDNEGMIFVFPRAQQMTFWMKDTPIPLSIAYIEASGRILEIYDMKPFDETEIPSASSSIAYALEVAKGWFGKHGVLPGDSIIGLPSTKIAH